MEGQELRDEINKVATRLEDLRGPGSRVYGMAGEPTMAERPPALQFAVDKIEREAHALVEVAEHMVNRLRLISTEEIDLSERAEKVLPERTGVQAADRILELGDMLQAARSRIQNALDRVAV